MAKSIPLTQNRFAVVDDQDFEWLNQWKWFYHAGYAVRNITVGKKKQKMIWMHRQILDIPDGVEGDHKDRDTLNNQRFNLRPATHSENCKNRKIRSDNKSGFIGVHWNKQREKWQSSIKANGKRLHLGFFIEPEKAALAHDEAARKYYGDFSVLNFDERQ